MSDTFTIPDSLGPETALQNFHMIIEKNKLAVKNISLRSAWLHFGIPNLSGKLRDSVLVLIGAACCHQGMLQ